MAIKVCFFLNGVGIFVDSAGMVTHPYARPFIEVEGITDANRRRKYVLYAKLTPNCGVFNSLPRHRVTSASRGLASSFAATS
jgi:hypothetical protein